MRQVFTVRALVVFLGVVPLAFIAVLLYKYVWSAELVGIPVVAAALFSVYIAVTLPWLAR